MTTYVSFVFLIVLVCARGADAQESRADTLKQAREEKQQAVAPYEPGMLETCSRPSSEAACRSSPVTGCI